MKPLRCTICKKVMDTGDAADENCGGDCAMCMANAGDGDCQHDIQCELLEKLYAFVNEQTKGWPEQVDEEARQYITETARFWKDWTK